MSQTTWEEHNFWRSSLPKKIMDIIHHIMFTSHLDIIQSENNEMAIIQQERQIYKELTQLAKIKAGRSPFNSPFKY